MLPSVCSASSVYISPAGHGSLLPYPPTITPSSIVDNPRADSAPPVSSATVENPPAVLSLSLRPFLFFSSLVILSFLPSFFFLLLQILSFFSLSSLSSPPFILFFFFFSSLLFFFSFFIPFA